MASAEPPPSTFGIDDSALARVVDALRATPGRPFTTRRVWFDTFDWRLWGDGLVLEVDDGAGARRSGRQAVLRDRTDNGVRWTQVVADVPRRSPDLPAGPWRRSLAATLAERTLLPAAAATVTTTPLVVTDADHKTTVELLREELRPEGGRGTTRHSVSVLRVVPRRGYDDAARRVVRRLERLGLERMPVHPLELASRDRVVGHDPSTLDVVLDPQLPSVDAVRELLTILWLAMQANEPWLAEPPDIEFLHDYRVALRRSRSILKQAKGAVGPELLAEWRPTLRELQQRTNTARDLDVFLDGLPQLTAAIPLTLVADLEPLRELVLELRNEDHAGLVAYLGSSSHRRLRAAYDALLSQPLASDDAPHAATPIASFATDRIRRTHRKLLAQGKDIGPASPSSDLHELRITGKELRYLLELYGSVFPPAPVKSLTKELKRLQNTLGAHQDAEVQAEALTGYAHLLQRGRPPARTLVAIGHLVAGATARQAEARKEFATRFKDFASDHTTSLIERLLR